MVCFDYYKSVRFAPRVQRNSASLVNVTTIIVVVLNQSHLSSFCSKGFRRRINIYVLRRKPPASYTSNFSSKTKERQAGSGNSSFKQSENMIITCRVGVDVCVLEKYTNRI